MRQVLPENVPLALPGQAADILIAAGEGDQALLYLYILRQGGLYAPEKAAQALAWDQARVERAFQSLSHLGLTCGGAPAAPAKVILEPAEEPPHYALEEVRERGEADKAFSDLLVEVQRILGRVLSGPDLLILFGIYDHLALPPEVILLLVNHCVEQLRRRYGEGRRLSLRSLEKSAYQWAKQGIRSLEEAERYLQAQAARQTELAKVRAVLGIRDRQLAPSESRFISSWLEMGYGAEVLELAYDRTVLGTGGLSWKYMDSIVKSWHSKGLKSLDQIREKDGNTRPGAQQGGPAAGQADDLALLRKQLGMK